MGLSKPLLEGSQWDEFLLSGTIIEGYHLIKVLFRRETLMSRTFESKDFLGNQHEGSEVNEADNLN